MFRKVIVVISALAILAIASVTAVSADENAPIDDSQQYCSSQLREYPYIDLVLAVAQGDSGEANIFGIAYNPINDVLYAIQKHCDMVSPLI